jgi:hypothetical protein
VILFLALFLLSDPSLFTYGTALVEAGAPEKGEEFLKGLLSTEITSESKNRILYNLGLSYLKRGATIEALGTFQQMDDHDSFTRQAIQKAFEQKPQPSFQTLSPLPSPLELESTIGEIENLLKNLTALPFENGENSSSYNLLKERLGEILKRKKEWWGTVIERQEQILPQGCALSSWEGITKRLGEGTLLLERGEQAFQKHEKPLATVYPLLLEGLNYLKSSKKELDQVETKGSEPVRSERLEHLSEMLEKDKRPSSPPPKEVLW